VALHLGNYVLRIFLLVSFLCPLRARVLSTSTFGSVFALENDASAMPKSPSKASCERKGVALGWKVVLGGVNDTLDLNISPDRLVENEVLLEASYTPHPQVWELAKLPRSTHGGSLRELAEAEACGGAETAGSHEAVALSNVREMLDEVAAAAGPHDNAGHFGLGFLPSFD
jgi:hypothetical protein